MIFIRQLIIDLIDFLIVCSFPLPVPMPHPFPYPNPCPSSPSPSLYTAFLPSTHWKRATSSLIDLKLGNTHKWRTLSYPSLKIWRLCFEARELHQILAVRPPCLFPIDSTLTLVASSCDPRSVTSDLQHNVSNEIPWMVHQEPVFILEDKDRVPV